MDTTAVSKRRIDWAWVGVGYCFFVVFHLLPSYVLLEFVRQGMGENVVRGMWLIAGLLVVGLYIGYRSRGTTILEPAISAMLYTITLMSKSGEFLGRSIGGRRISMMLVWGGVAFLIAMLGAWIGEMLQAQKEKRAKAS